MTPVARQPAAAGPALPLAAQVTEPGPGPAGRRLLSYRTASAAAAAGQQSLCTASACSTAPAGHRTTRPDPNFKFGPAQALGPGGEQLVTVWPGMAGAALLIRPPR
jgi:hypothetical protein